jgi:hypothetical protein
MPSDGATPQVSGPIGELTREQLLDLERRILAFLGSAAWAPVGALCVLE